MKDFFVLMICLVVMVPVKMESFYGVYNVSRESQPLTQVTVDTDGGNIYVGGKNILVHLDTNLNMIKEQVIGPVQDNSNCFPYPQNCAESRQWTENHVRVLEINEQKDYILMCGSVNQGVCSCHSLNDISSNHTLVATDVENYVGTNISYAVSVTFGSQHSLSGSTDKLLYVAMGMDNRPLAFRPKMISTREFQYSDSEWSLQYYAKLGTHGTYLTVDDTVQDLFQSYYIYSFEYEKHVYHISVQMRDPFGDQAENNVFVTKIIQICKDDMAYASYTELPLQCDHNGRKYEVAVDAFFATAPKLLPVWEHKLFITFGINRNLNPNPEITEGSVMCFFFMNEILGNFSDLQNDCFNKGTAIQPAWVYGRKLTTPKMCALSSRYKSDEFCGLSSTIGIQDSVPQHAAVSKATTHVKDAVLSSVAVYTEGEHTVAVMGTYGGHILKTKVDADNREVLPYMNFDLTGSKTMPIQQDMELDAKEDNLFVLTGNQVIKFPLRTCEVYSTCETCVTTDDPLMCGWCVDRCTKSSECIKPTQALQGVISLWTPDTCAPIIYSIYPLHGPLDGNTPITITGQNFGSRQASETQVHVGNHECTISYPKNFTSIVCISPSVTTVGLLPVSVKISDDSRSAVKYKIGGTYTLAKQPFHYKLPIMANFTPSIGPLSGGTAVTIRGDNLDIGKDRSVKVAHHPCTLISYNASTIICETTTWTPGGFDPGVSDRGTKGPVEVNMDGTKYPIYMDYSYLPNSQIENIYPPRSMQSGGIRLTVTGTNLHIVAEPRIGITIVKTKKTPPTQRCVAQADGRKMTCPSVNITGFIEEELDPIRSEDYNVWFKMDGIQELGPNTATDQAWKANFRYYPDPNFYKFSESGHIRLLDITEKSLDIKGEYLDLGIRLSDVKILIGTNSACNVTKLKGTVMYCNLYNKPASPSSQRHRVLVTAGRITRDVGFLVFTMTEESTPITTIILIIAIVVVIVLIIIFVIILKKKHIYPFSKPYDPYMAHYQAGRPLDANGQRVFDLQNRENAYAEQRMSESGAGAAASILSALDDDTLLVLRDKNLLIDREWLTLGEILGRGHFGCVHKAYLTFPDTKGDTLVAVKTLHNDNPREIDVQSFIEEALRMKDFHDDNVLTLTGICFGIDDMPLVVLPYMSHGDLLSYIRNEQNNPTIKDLIMYGIDIARGMDYLSGLKFVHRDLAARNCMLDDNFRALVADFGLSRDIYERDYYSSDNKKSKLPVKWMAPESLEKGNYNSKSDVWSYGICLWELMTRGVNPYPEVDNWDVLRYIKAGRRMPQPPFSPDTLYKIMTKCWAFNPNDRPTFSVLAHEVSEMITVLEQQMKQGEQRINIQSTYVNVDTATDYHYGDASRSAAIMTADVTEELESEPSTPLTTTIA